MIATVAAFAQIVRDSPRGVGVVEVEIRQREATVLHHAVPPARGAGGAVPRGLLVRVLAVSKLLTGAIEREHEVLRERVVALEPRHDRGVVRGRARERVERERAARGVAERALLAELGQHVVVLCGVGDDGDPCVVLRRRARHRRATDVDGLDVG